MMERMRPIAIGTVLLLFVILLLGCGSPNALSQNKKAGKDAQKTGRDSGRKKMSEELGYPTVDEGKANSQLESYVFEIRHGRKVEPRNLDPKHVEEFTRKKIDRTREPASFARIRSVIDFYDLAVIKDHFEKLLQRGEKDENQVLQSLESVRIIAEQGSDNDRKNAFGYYEYLVGLPASVDQFEEFTRAADSFGPEYSGAKLTEAMKKQYAVLKEKGKSNEFLDGEAEQLFSLINGRLPQMVEMIGARSRVLAIDRPEERMRKLVMIYLGIDTLTGQDFERWSARQLRRMAREGDPKQVVAVFRGSYDAIKSAGFEKEDDESRRLRVARAIRFFGGELNEEEKARVAEGSEHQVDYLDRDFY